MKTNKIFAKKRILLVAVFAAFVAVLPATLTAQNNEQDATAITNGVLDNWYLRAGLDMTLQCPYGKDFSQVFPKGKSFGIDVAAGKWFSPQIALALRVNWENGFPLFRNRHLQWLSGSGDESNMDKGGYVAVSLDVPVSVTNIVRGYNAGRRFDLNLFARAGLISNMATSSMSPLIGGGFGATWRLNPLISFYGDFGLQTTTSEFYEGVALTGMKVSTGFNCFFDIELGVQFNLGVSTWKMTKK